MKPLESETDGNKLEAALKGLGHPVPQARLLCARNLGDTGGLEELTALKQVYLTETNILCKTEMIRAAVNLEKRLGLADAPAVPTLEGANSRGL